MEISEDGKTISGRGEPGATVTITDPAGNVIGAGTVGKDGTFEVILKPPQTNGEELDVTLTDPAGNESPSASVDAPDSTAPNAPADLVVSEDGLTLSGTGEPGATVEVLGPNGEVLGTGVVGNDGTFSIPLSPAQVNGEDLTVGQTDAAGNESPTASVEAPDSTAPAAPTATISADGATMTGTAEPGATVTVTGPDADGDGQPDVLGTAVAGDDGSYTIALSPAQIDGQPLEVTATDPAGNVSPSVPVMAPDLDGVDTTPPNAPADLVVSEDGLTLSGTGEPGATVEVLGPNGEVLGTGVVGNDGTFSIPLSPAQVNGEDLTVGQTDAAGNESPTASVEAPDSTAPAAPTATISADGATMTGTAEPGATVTVTGPDADGDGQPDVLGTAVAGDDGSYTIALSPAQIDGQPLEVTATDPAGNVSVPVAVTAPNLETPPIALHNLDDAGIDIVGPQIGNDVELDSHTYLVLLSLVGMDLSLGAPGIAFTVADQTQSDITFTYSSLLDVGVAADYSLVVQQFVNGQWVTLGDDGSAGIITMGLLGSNAMGVTVEGLGAGQYRAFMTYNGLAGGSVLGTLTAHADTYDITQIDHLEVETATGNVITGDSTEGDPDIVTSTTIVQSVNGVAVAADGSTVVQGEHGTLQINQDGSYVYTPNSDTAAIGQAETFQYVLVDTATGATTQANLYIHIGSPDAELTWDPANPGADATRTFDAVDDAGTAGVTYVNTVTDNEPAEHGAFNTPFAIFPVTREFDGAFTVASNDEASITIYARSEGLLSVLPSYTITIWDATGTVVATASGMALAGILGNSFTLDVDALLGDDFALTAGDYTYTVSTTNNLGFGYDTTVFVEQDILNLDEFVVGDVTEATGNLLDNDAPGSDYTTIEVFDGTNWVEVSSAGSVTVNGLAGSLYVDADGNYVYTPVSAAAPTDTFSYRLVHPDGTVDEATLIVTVEASGAGVNGGAAAMSMLSTETDGSDVVPLSDVTTTDNATDATISSYELRELLLADSSDLTIPSITLESAGSSSTGSASATATGTTTTTSSTDVEDPLGYLVIDPLTQEDQHQTSVA
ncbi:BapA/Bap/LapF family large adhesin [Ensifer adhaerens]|uniref:BapA/Bap/LapF family large adhesin n=1 Tax=Ensifer adhaerens TaxID=106592 RepID=UPI00384A8A96